MLLGLLVIYTNNSWLKRYTNYISIEKASTAYCYCLASVIRRHVTAWLWIANVYIKKLIWVFKWIYMNTYSLCAFVYVTYSYFEVNYMKPVVISFFLKIYILLWCGNVCGYEDSYLKNYQIDLIKAFFVRYVYWGRLLINIALLYTSIHNIVNLIVILSFMVIHWN